MKVLAYLEAADSANSLSVAFSTLGHSFQAFGASETLLAQLKGGDADLVLIGWSAAGLSGLDMLCWIRRNCPTGVAVAFLSGHDAPADVALALRSGADDYFVSPMQYQELTARCEALIRRVSPGRLFAAESYRVAAYTLNSRMQTVALNGAVITLTPQEMQLAMLFFRNVSKPLTREYIRDTVWGAHAQIAARAIDTQLSRLRSKLMLYQENGLRLRPLYRQGYVLEPWDDEVSANHAPSVLQKSDSNVSRT